MNLYQKFKKRGMAKCSWCSNTVETKSDKFEESFCSLKCLHEYSEKGYTLTEKKGCFIATAVYGSYDHHIVYDLRLFRDNWLQKRNWGRKFIEFYYKKGPHAARFIESNSTTKYFVRLTLIRPLHFIVTKSKLHKKIS